VRWREDIFRAAARLKGRRELQDRVQDGWVSVFARGNTHGVLQVMRESRRKSDRRGMTNRADDLSPGVREHWSDRDPQGKDFLTSQAGGWSVVGSPRKTAGDYEPTGRPPGRPPRKAPAGAPGKLLLAAGIPPFPDGMGELRSLVGAGRGGRDPRLVKAVVDCQEWGAAELARLLGCSPQAINAILREHGDS
jgi:hypothetical protein